MLHRRLDRLKQPSDYASVRLDVTSSVVPSARSFFDLNTEHAEHADNIATLYNEAWLRVRTKYVLCLEDDVIAPSNAITGLLPLVTGRIAYAAGTQMGRHKEGLLLFDLVKSPLFGPEDECKEIQAQLRILRHPWGCREIGAGHLGLAMLNKSIVDDLSPPPFKARSSLANGGSLLGCDLVLGFELSSSGHKCMANFDVRALHINTQGEVL